LSFSIFLNHLVNKLLDNFLRIWSFPNFFVKDLELIYAFINSLCFFTHVNLKAKDEVWFYLFIYFSFGTLGCWWVKIVVSIELDYSFVLTFIHFPFASQDNYDYNQNSPIKDFTRIFSLVLIWLSSFKLKH
jgi:hypothetical protein